MAPGPASASDESQDSLRGDLMGVSASGVSKLPSESELSSWSPRVASVRLHHLLQRVRHRSREAKQLLREGSTEGEGSHRDHRRGEGTLSRPSTWLKGKGCFVIWGLNFQRLNRKCPLELGAQGRKPGGLPSVWNSPEQPCLEFQAPSESRGLSPPYSFLPLTLSSSTFFFLMERQLRS